MVTTELVVYVKDQLNSGIQPQEIHQVLRAKGWQESDINQALLEAGFQAPNKPGQPLLGTVKPSSFANNHKNFFWVFGLLSAFVVTLIIAVFIIGPVIIISTFSLEPKAPKFYEETSAKVSVRNWGIKKGSHKITLSVNGELIEEQTVDFKALEQKTVTFQFKPEVWDDTVIAANEKKITVNIPVPDYIPSDVRIKNLRADDSTEVTRLVRYAPAVKRFPEGVRLDTLEHPDLSFQVSKEGDNSVIVIEFPFTEYDRLNPEFSTSPEQYYAKKWRLYKPSFHNTFDDELDSREPIFVHLSSESSQGYVVFTLPANRKYIRLISHYQYLSKPFKEGEIPILPQSISYVFLPIQVSALISTLTTSGDPYDPLAEVSKVKNAEDAKKLLDEKISFYTFSTSTPKTKDDCNEKAKKSAEGISSFNNEELKNLTREYILDLCDNRLQTNKRIIEEGEVVRQKGFEDLERFKSDLKLLDKRFQELKKLEETDYKIDREERFIFDIQKLEKKYGISVVEKVNENVHRAKDW